MIKFLLGAGVMFVVLMLWRRSEPSNGAAARPQRVLPAPGSDVERLVREHRLIEAVKAYRAEAGCGLKEAKAAVDALKARLG